ncbi:PaaI family thioesterase [Marinospirillum sp.]|uniref:PaaI family thioesterase n=1 Tax=Marinospirillum sp. TaxID=2183934 RepID=UPI00286FFB42|nr:PaaI family thioesterase [Marinospirillum sp.]MDR9467166.1 PaaI family thioesterase [Marinospirillum sp.]
MNESDLQTAQLGQRLSADEVNSWFDKIPYAQLLGVTALEADKGLVFELASKADNVGNPLLPALHGGVLAGFMETAAILNVMAYSGGHRVPKVIDFSIDYLRSAGLKTTLASCQVGRLGKRVVNVSVTAWQGEQQEQPVALARAHLVWPNE